MAADPVVSPADTRQRVMYLLDALCQDSLELPLSHVDDPFTDSHIASMFKELRDLVAALLAVGERDRRQIARYEKALQEIADTDTRLGEIAAAVLAGEEDAG